MKCPVCGASLPLQSDRCPDCGYRCKITQAAPDRPAASSAYYTPPNQTKKKWGCCCAIGVIVPLLLLIAAMIFAVSQITMEFSENILDEEFFGDFPFEELTPESLPAAANEGCFAVTDGALSFLRDSWDGSAVLRIPGTVGGETVTSIGAGCFAGCEELTTVILPDSVTRISTMAFSGCTGLRGLFLPDGMEFIAHNAFDLCRELEAIRIPASVSTIAPGCFSDCASLRYIFYEGTYEDWNALYSEYITPFTAVFCLDGNYYHAAGQ